MSTIQVGAYGINTNVFGDMLQTNCNNREVVVHLNAWGNAVNQLYIALNQCSNNVEYTLDQREAMAQSLLSIAQNAISQCNSYRDWAWSKADAAPWHGAWGNDDSCNKRRSWWYDHSINPSASMRGIMIDFKYACQNTLSLIAEEEQSEYQEEIWEDELIANDIANGNQLILLQATAEKANEASYGNKIQQIIVPGILITVGYLLVKKKV